MFKQLKNAANFIGTLSYGVLFVTFVFQVIRIQQAFVLER